MTSPRSFREVVKLWPSCEALRDDLAALGYEITARGVSYWAERDAIPVAWWDAIAQAARRRKLPVQIGLLAELARRGARRAA